MSEPTSLDELLAHEGFLRALVRGLVHGESEVDDVLQETWAVALRRSPREPRALRGWLARVARNAAFSMRRSETRRAHREAASARPEGIPSPLEILEREATRRRLVHTVLALDPLYRDPIVLRWLEGLPVPEVAARLGVPIATAKTRLRRGLERIRERLDERTGGDRRAWMASLAPLAGRALRTPPEVAAPSPAATDVLRTLSPRLVALVATATLGAGVSFFLLRVEPDPARVVADRGAISASPSDTGLAAAGRMGGARGADLETAPTPSAGPQSFDRSRAFAPGARPLAVLRGVVVGLDGSTPAPGVAVSATEGGAATPDALAPSPTSGATRLATTDRDGRFEIADVPAGAWRVRARGQGGAEADVVATAVADAGPDAAASAAWVRIVLARPPPSVALRVKVLGPDGRAVPDARVELDRDDGAPALVASSDGAGLATFELPALPDLADSRDRTGNAGATLNVTSEGRSGWRRIPDLRAARLDVEPLAVALAVGGRIRGVVRDADGRPAARAEVQAWRWTSLWRGPPVRGMRVDATTDAGGAFVLDGLPPGVHVLLVRGGGVCLADLPGAADGGLRWVRVRSGDETSIDLRVARGGILSGRVLDEAGAPLSAARVELRMPYGPPYGPDPAEEGGAPTWSLAAPWPMAADHPYGRRVLTTDGDGRYELDGLPTSAAWRLVVSAPGRTFDARANVAVRAGERTALEHRLLPSGTLEALVPPGATVVVRRDGEDRPVAVIAAADGASGALTLPGLAPGPYSLSLRSWRPDATAAPVAFEVRGGATTLVDASTRIVGRTRLTLRRGDRALPGASLLTGGVLRIADADGRVAAPGGAGAGVPVALHVRAPEADATRLLVTWPAPEWETPTLERALDLPDGRVRVRVLDGDGRPVVGASVRLAGTGLAMGGDALAAVDERRFTDGQGIASFAGLPAGGFDLAVDGPSSLARASRALHVPEDDGILELVLGHP